MLESLVVKATHACHQREWKSNTSILSDNVKIENNNKCIIKLSKYSIKKG